MLRTRFGFKGLQLAVMVAGVLALSAGQASAVLLESWETGTNGWDTFGPGTGGTVSSSNLHATNGLSTLQVSNPVNNSGMESPFLLTYNAILGTALNGEILIDIWGDPSLVFLGTTMFIVNNELGFVQPSPGFTGTALGGTTLTFTLTPAQQATLLASPSGTRIGFNFGFAGPAGSGPIFYDNLRAAEIPEPAALGLVGLGGLMMAARRRK